MSSPAVPLAARGPLPPPVVPRNHARKTLRGAVWVPHTRTYVYPNGTPAGWWPGRREE